MTFHDRIPLYVSSFAAVLVALSFVIGVSVGLGALAVGLFLPVLGLSLLCFLAVDLLVGLRARRRPAGWEPTGTSNAGATPAQGGTAPDDTVRSTSH